MQTLLNMHKSMAGSFNKKNQIDSNASATYDLTGTYLGNDKENHGKIIIFLFFQFCKIYIITYLQVDTYQLDIYIKRTFEVEWSRRAENSFSIMPMAYLPRHVTYVPKCYNLSIAVL